MVAEKVKRPGKLASQKALRKKPRDLSETYKTLKSETKQEFVERKSKEDTVVYAARNLTNEAGDPLEYIKEHYFLQQILRDYPQELCIQKSSQVGLTTAAISKSLYLAHIDNSRDWSKLFGVDTNGIRIIYTFPTAKDVEDFSAMRFKPMILSNTELLADMGGKKGADAVGRKRIRNSSVIFRGTQKETQAISNPADLIINDELDFSAPDITEMFQSRIEHSKFKWWWRFSTPTIPGYGIDAEYKKSNQFRWLVKCIHCNKDQEVKWKRNILRKKIRGNRFSFWGCVKCGKELDRSYGQWIARYPKRDYHGYYVPPTIAGWIQPKDIMRARKTYKKDKNFYNFALGLAYADGEALLTREQILANFEFGTGYNPIIDQHVFMGVDQGDVLHYEIARSNNGVREIIEVGTRTSFDEIGALIRAYNVSLTVMDALPNHHSAKNFAKDFYGRVHLAYYKSFDSDETAKEAKDIEHGLLIDRTDSLDQSAESWRSGKTRLVLNRSKYHRIPDFIDDPTGKDGFVQQMTNMVRDEIEDARTQKARAVWVKIGADHYRHADNYCNIAFLQRNGGVVDLSGLVVVQNPVYIVSGNELLLMEARGPRSDLRSQF